MGHGGDTLTNRLHLVAQRTNILLWTPTEPQGTAASLPCCSPSAGRLSVLTSGKGWLSQTLEGNEWIISTTLSVSDGSSVLRLNGNPVGVEQQAVKKCSGVQWKAGGSSPAQVSL